MHMTTMRCLAWTMMFGATAALAADPPAADLQTRLEQARQRLDAAAREFAELHGELGAPMTANFAYERRGMLGIVLGPVDGDGIRILGVTPGSGAQAAGLKAGDVILAVAGTPVGGSVRGLTQALASPQPGDVVTVDFLRDKETQSIDVTVAESQPFQLPLPEQGAMNMGVVTATAAVPAFVQGGPPIDVLQLHDVDANLGRYFGVASGVLVLQAAESTGLEGGDILVNIADQPVRNAGDAFGRLMNGADGLTVTVLRDGAERTIDFEPGSMPPMGGRVFRIEQGQINGPDHVQVFRSE